MISVPIINKDFIDSWEPQFIEVIPGCESYPLSEKHTYEEILRKLQSEISKTGNIIIETAKMIVQWKSPRSINKFNWDLYNRIYGSRFSLILSNQIGDYHKLTFFN